MKDEKYIFMQDIREKKAAARSSYNRRTHTGKSGAKKWPAELMTKKGVRKNERRS